MTIAINGSLSVSTCYNALRTICIGFYIPNRRVGGTIPAMRFFRQPLWLVLAALSPCRPLSTGHPPEGSDELSTSPTSPAHRATNLPVQGEAGMEQPRPSPGVGPATALLWLALITGATGRVHNAGHLPAQSLLPRSGPRTT